MASRLGSGRTLSRRSFISGAAALTGGLALGTRAFGARRPQANDMLDVAVVGVGGQGAANIGNLLFTNAVNIVALCDCDERQAAESFAKLPNARRYSDWRKLLDAEKSIDAVLVATPDHNHAIISISAMRLGKHVYCEKPLAHSIWEARQMARVAAEMKVATQMGTQGHAYEGTRRAVEAIRAGLIGEVKELHVWTDRPAGWWPQGVRRPTDVQPVPAGLDWDVWLGPAQERPYHEAYVPFKWRGFWEFGTGAIGDMGIHNLDTAYWGLGLGIPTQVTVKDCSPGMMEPETKETAPLWTITELKFPAQDGRPGVTMMWYDGGKLPPDALFQGEKLIGRDGGSLVIGSRGTLFTRTWHGGQTEGDMFVLLPRKQYEGVSMPAESVPRTPSHHHEWVDACRGRGKTLSEFGYASWLTESLLLGNVALRTGKAIEWDPSAMRVTNAPEAEAFVKPTFRNGWSL
jgi:predicted dehydrogenase